MHQESNAGMWKMAAGRTSLRSAIRVYVKTLGKHWSLYSGPFMEFQLLSLSMRDYLQTRHSSVVFLRDLSRALKALLVDLAKETLGELL